MERELSDKKLREHVKVVKNEYPEMADQLEDGVVNGMGGNQEDAKRAAEIWDEEVN